MSQTLGALFDARAVTYADSLLLEVPVDAAREYYPDGYTCTFGEARQVVDDMCATLAHAGYGHGHRVAVLLGNRPEMMLLKIALARLGASWVPVNPDYRPPELAYLLQDSAADLAIVATSMADMMEAGIAESGRNVAMVTMDGALPTLPAAPCAGPISGPVTQETEASLIYTSGTTGRPKGCILSHGYEVDMGQWYARRGGLIVFEPCVTKVYCPLPLFHVNAAVLLFWAVVETGCAQIVPERFRARAWWRELAETGATAAHYLGIVIPALMNRAPEDWEQKHQVKWAVGAGVEPTLHGPFEERFGFPLIEVWGMTEMCRILGDFQDPRQINTRAMGRAQPGLEVRVVDGEDCDVPSGQAGEMVIRFDENSPRKGAFSGYLNLPEATQEAWRGGWFHTGDTVRMDGTGMIFFVDRKKNIIRRSGENIAAAEIEACLQEHPDVERVAVIAVEDEMRDEEVMACIQTRIDADAALADTLFEWCFGRLSYYKAPGWIRFLADIPVTGTQKIQKHALFGTDEDPTNAAHDFRDRKKRN